MRDSHFCGVPYGLFDLHQLHRSFVAGGSEDERTLWINRDGVHAVEQYVLAKYYLTSMVYRHQVRLITDQMITRAIVLGVEHDGIEELRKMYSFGDSDSFVSEYIGWDDARFLNTFACPKYEHKLCYKMLRRLEQRELLKQVYSLRIADFGDAAVRELLPRLSKPENEKLRQDLEDEVAELVRREYGGEIERRFVVLFAFDIRSVRETSRDDEASIMVDTVSGPRLFEEESTLFSSINEMYSDGYVEVYAPVRWKNPTERKTVRDRLRQPIRDLVEDRCKSKAENGEGL